MLDMRKEVVLYLCFFQLAWIGLYDDVDSWRWSLADGGFYTDQEAEYRNWAHREPNNWKGQEKCGMVYDSGEWNDFNCESDKPAVCAEVRGEQTFTLNLMDL